jgi:predicted permease
VVLNRLPGDPSLFGRLRFAVGLKLAPDNREWVRHELIDAGWRARVVLRHLVVMIPACLLLALLPGPPWLRIMVPALALAGSLFTVTIYADDIRAARLRQHGLEVPDDPDIGRPTH